MIVCRCGGVYRKGRESGRRGDIGSTQRLMLRLPAKYPDVVQHKQQFRDVTCSMRERVSQNICISGLSLSSISFLSLGF